MYKNNWYQIEIEVFKDIEDLSGENLHSVITLISEYLEIQYIVVDDLDGPFGIDTLKHQCPKILSLKQFGKIFKGISRFEWGDFYLFSEREKSESFIKEEGKYAFTKDYPYKLIPFVEAIVSVFDSFSFVIYTDNLQIVESIKKKYPAAKIEERTVEQLKFYY